MVTKKEASLLIDFARLCISSEFNTEKKKNLESERSKLGKLFTQKRGLFVTLKKKGELRGCIGYVIPAGSIINTIEAAAIAAAFDDPRFPPVEKNELNYIKIEFSVLTVPEKINGNVDEILKQIRIGKDGLIITRKPNKGLLLPQVFVEYKCTPLSALELTCNKAGLKPGSWKEKNCIIEKFQTEIFEE